MSSKSKKKTPILGVSNVELEELLAKAHAPPAGTSSVSRACAFVAAVVSLFCLDKFFCEHVCTFRDWSHGLALLMISSPLDCSRPCVHVPFMWWPNLSPGLDGCAHQDRIHCPGNVF